MAPRRLLFCALALMPEATSSPAQAPYPWLALAALGLFCVWPFWLPAYVPSLDGPAHLYMAFVLREMGEMGAGGAAIWGDYFAADWGLSTNLFFYWLSYLLLAVFEAPTIEKIVISTFAISWPWVSYFALRPIAARPLAGTILLLPVIFAKLSAMGFYNYLLALELFVICLGIWLRLERGARARWYAALSGLAFAGVFVHVFPIAALLLVLFLFGLWTVARQRSGAGPWSKPVTQAERRIAFYLLALLPSFLLIAYYLATNTGAEGGFDYALPWYFRILFLLLFMHFYAFGMVDMALCVALAIIALTAVYDQFRAPQPPPASSLSRFLAWLSLFLGLCFIAIPSTLPQGGHAHTRLGLIFYICFVFWLFSKDFSPSYGKFFRLLAGLLLLTLAPLRAYQMYGLDRMLGEFAAIGDAVTQERTLLSVSNGAMAGGNAFYDMDTRRRTPAVAHFSARLAVQRKLVDLKLIQANYPFSPLRYRAMRNPFHYLPADQPAYPARLRLAVAETLRLEGTPPQLDIPGYERRTGGRVDYLLVWGDVRTFRASARQRNFMATVEATFNPEPLLRGRNFQLYERR